MGFLDFFNFGRQTDKIINKANANTFNPIGYITASYDYNKIWAIETALLKNPDVYSVINQQSSKAASVPNYVRSIRDEEELKRYNFARKTNNLQSQLKTKARTFDKDYYPMPIAKPNPLQNWNDFWQLSEMYFRATGNVFWYVLKNLQGEPIGIYNLPSHLIKIYLKENTSELAYETPIAGYEMFTTPGVSVPFLADEVIHIKMPNPNHTVNGDQLYGLSPLASAYFNIENQIEANRHLMKMFKSSGAFGFIHAKGETLDENQAKQFSDRIKEMDLSKDRMAKISGVGIDMGFTRISLANDELKPWEALKWDRKTICNVLGWADELLNNDGKSGLGGSEAKEARKQVLMDTIMPDLLAFEEAFNEGFLQQFKGYKDRCLKFDHTQMPEMQEDMVELNKWAKEAPITHNEWREMLNFERIEEDGMDSVFVNRNLQPIEMSYINSNLLNDIEREEI